MTMPVNLVLLRHGESEGNLANDLSKKGDDSMFTPDFRSRYSASWNLTPKGIEQAKTAGIWVKENIAVHFDRYYVAEYHRAMQTAAHADFDSANWRLDFLLRERDWGQLDVATRTERRGKYAEEFKRRDRDGFFWAPPGGESMAHICLRIDRIIQTLHRECSDKNVIIVCHGEVMWAFRVRLERLNQIQYRQLDSSTNPWDKINNCQVIHYTRRNPKGHGELMPHLSWMRSICPWNEELSNPNWQILARPTYSNEELLEMTKV
jgi:NAD+ kinase